MIDKTYASPAETVADVFDGATQAKGYPTAADLESLARYLGLDVRRFKDAGLNAII